MTKDRTEEISKQAGTLSIVTDSERCEKRLTKDKERLEEIVSEQSIAPERSGWSTTVKVIRISEAK